MYVSLSLGGSQRGTLYGPAVIAAGTSSRVSGEVPIGRGLPGCVGGTRAPVVEVWEGEASPPRRTSIAEICLREC